MIPASMTLRGLLDARRAEGRALSLDEAIGTIVPLCMDLQKRHAQGELVFVHPSCIAPGADGLARISKRLAQAPTSARDRACLAPELQSTLEPGNARASVFSIGAILYECVTGAMIGPAMRRPREINPGLPEAVEVLIAKALIGDPAHRPDDLGALASAMHHVAPMKSIHPPDVDAARLDRSADFEVDIRLSMLPPDEIRQGIAIPAAPGVPRLDATDPFGNVIDRPSNPRPSGPNVAERLSSLKARLESDPRPRYVVNKDRMDHGPFSAVELLQQIATNSFVDDDVLRDELSGQSRPIKEWDEFAPFAEQAHLGREVVAEKKEVAKAVAAEKKAGLAKSTIGLVVVAAIAAGAALWFFQVRGSRKDDVEIVDDSTLDLSLDGGIKGAHRNRQGGGGGGRGGGGGGAYAPGGMSYEAAIAANPQQIDMNGHAMGPDLTDGQLSAPMSNMGRFLNQCGAPESMKVTAHVAVKLGRAVGVTVDTNPHDGSVASCIDHQVRGLTWPSNPKLDSFTTRY